MKTAIFLILLSLVSSYKANAQTPCAAGTLSSAWILQGSYKPSQFGILVKYGTVEKEYQISQMFDSKLGFGKINSAWALRSDMYGQQALSILVDFANTGKTFYTKQNQPVCVRQSTTGYALEIKGQ